jgi:hypothetical protein
MEHFANEYDMVARLGILSPLRHGPRPLIEIDGPVFEQKGGWGHLLNEHYLTPIDKHLYPASNRSTRPDSPYIKSGQRVRYPRLYEYFHGKQPSR